MKNELFIEHQLQQDEILYFMHIPKTAGLSFANMLDNYFKINEIRPNINDPFFKKEKLGEFSKYQFIRGHMGFGLYKGIAKKLVYITILRNPLDHILSRYNHYVQSFLINKQEINKEPLSLNEILDHPKLKWSFINPQTRFLTSNIDMVNLAKNACKQNLEFNPMEIIESIPPEISDEALIKIGKDRLSRITFLGITEKFLESVFLLCYTFGWKPMPDISRINISRFKGKKALTKNIIEKINEFTRVDVQLYEFGKLLFENRYNNMIKNLTENFRLEQKNSLNQDIIKKTLELNFFKKNFCGGNAQTQKVIEFNFSEPMYGSGWYGREKWYKNNIIFRWSGPGTNSIIEFPISKKNNLKIRISVITKMNEKILKSLKLFVDGNAIPLKIFYNDDSSVFEGFIQKSFLNPKIVFNQFRFQINETVCPHDIDKKSTDPRQLGLGFSKIIIEPFI